jgi:hypothetical protein
MWYREAITRVDPSGQINMDFPGIKPKPFDLKNINFEVEEFDKNSYRINANLDEKILGHIDFQAEDYSDTGRILFIELYEYPLREAEDEEEMFNNPSDRTKMDMLEELKDAEYHVDESSVTRAKWGIGKRLYQEMKKFLQNHKPTIQYISGDVHSRDAFEIRNSVFGLPIESYDSARSSSYEINEKTPQKEREDISFKIFSELPPARFDAMGSGDIPFDSFSVKHRLTRPSYNKTQEYKDSKLEPQLFSSEDKDNVV